MGKFSVVAMGVLFLGAGVSVAAARQTVTLTSTADFKQGNNEGLISTAQNRVTRDLITASTVGSWSATSALPSGRTLLASVAHSGFVYAIGGYTGDGNPAIPPNRADVLVASISDLLLPLQVPVEDGSAGTWSATTALPSGRRGVSSVAYNGFLYVIGGLNTNPNQLVDVLVAPFNANGSVGAWTATTALPSARFGHTSVAYNGFLYIIGGGGSGDVLFAPINADGSIGAWSATTALPSARENHTSVACNGFLYVMGGNGPSFTEQSDVQVSPIHADGSIDAWSATTALPSARAKHTSVVHNGFVYVIGGEDNGTPLSDVLFAPINADGSIGAWSATTALPSARHGHASSVYNGFVYTLGGFNGDVLVAPIDADSVNGHQIPGRLRGFYSRLVDLQADTSTRLVTLNGQLSPGGVVRLQARVAPDSTKVFGAETVVTAFSMGSAVEIPGTGRYVWVRLTLDDTATSNAAQATYVSDITVSPIGSPSAGVVFDGPGADIATQTSTSTIEANWSGFTLFGGDTIDFYEWSIGTASGLTDVQSWVSVGPATSASNSTLSLSAGDKFVSVRVTSSSGMTSPVATSDGVQVLSEQSDPGGGGGGGGCGLTGVEPAILFLILAAWKARRRLRRRTA